MPNSPTMDGLRLVYREPALGLAEVAWRWTVATVASLLLGFLVIEYIGSLLITRRDLLLLTSGVPRLVMATVRHILMSGVGRFAVAAIIVGSALGVLWVVAASVARAAMIRAMLDSIRPGAELVGGMHSELGSLLGLHSLRIGLLIAAMLAWTCAAVLAGFAHSLINSPPGWVFLLLLALGFLIAVLWKCLDWLFAIAPIFIIRSGSHTFQSVLLAARFVLERKRAVIAVSMLLAAIHLVVFFAASSIASMSVTFLGILPGQIITLALVLLSLVYFAVIDFLQAAKLAAYIAILAPPDESYQPAPLSRPPVTPPASFSRPEDDTLSDVSGLIGPPEPI